MPQHIFWYSAFEGNPPKGSTEGYNQYGLFTYDKESWSPTNEEMNAIIMERDINEEELGDSDYRDPSQIRRPSGRRLPP
jgi:hypothetical protein